MKQEYIFYVPDLFNSQFRELPRDESVHFLKSLRGRSGDTIQVTDGCGNLFHAVTSIERANVILHDVQRVAEMPLLPLPVLAIALLKHHDRMEWLVEKAVEIGISEVIWLFTEKSTRYGYRPERMERIAISAMKQSGRLWLPKITGPVEFVDGIGAWDTPAKFIAHCQSDGEKIPLSRAAAPSRSSFLLIGPEADFSNEEVRLAKQLQFVSVGLGNARLRAETAAIFGLSIVSGLSEG
jgi:16S rRNA (uracil1498-N3)-methyltransferase